MMIGQGVVAQWQVALDYDTSRETTLKGEILGSIFPGPTADIPVVLWLRVPSSTATGENWIVTGLPSRLLHQAGWTTETLAWKEEVTVIGYVRKSGSKVGERLANALLEGAAGWARGGTPLHDELRRKDALILHAIEIVKVDGQKLAFGEPKDNSGR
jgi:hypothetical protein